MKRHWFAVAVSAIAVLTLARVAATHRVFSQTFDESAHLAAGWEWQVLGTYRLDATHPPLARVFFGLPFRGVRSTPLGIYTVVGNYLFNHDGRYVRNVQRARLGNLLFLAIAMLAVTFWTRRMFGDVAAVVALLLFANAPPVLAHAGLATTDTVGTAMLAVALWAVAAAASLSRRDPSQARDDTGGSRDDTGVVRDDTGVVRDDTAGSRDDTGALPAAASPRCHPEPARDLVASATRRRILLLGLAIGLGVLSKFSFIPFFGIAALVMFLARRPSWRILAAIPIALIVIWGGYRFHVGTMEPAHPWAAWMTSDFFGSEELARTRIPAPALLAGLLEVHYHDQKGHAAFLLGEVRRTGWWYYFPVALAVKTPLPLLLLFAAGAVQLIRRRQFELVAIFLALLAFAMTSKINIGVRHVLPLYVLMAIVGASAAVRPAVRIALIGWMVVSSALAHPDYLPWMNALAGRHPERVLLDSNFDWGQDLLRLAAECRRRRITHLHANLFTTADLAAVGLPPTEFLPPGARPDGWIAIGESQLRLADEAEGYAWLEARPFVRVGKTIRLYAPPVSSRAQRGIPRRLGTLLPMPRDSSLRSE